MLSTYTSAYVIKAAMCHVTSELRAGEGLLIHRAGSDSTGVGGVGLHIQPQTNLEETSPI